MWDIPDDFRKDLKELVTLLTSNSDLQWIYDYIDNYEIEEDEEEQEYLSNYPIDPEMLVESRKLETLQSILLPEFMLQLDWKEGVEELKLGIESLLQDNFNASVPLPSLRNYDDRTSVSSDFVFKDFQRALKKHGFSLSNIQSGDDTYWIIVFPTAYHDQIEQLINKLGAELDLAGLI